MVRKGEDIGLLLWVGKCIALRQGKARDGLTLRRGRFRRRKYRRASTMRQRDVGGEAVVRALVEAGGQRSADGTPAAPRQRSFKLSLLQRR